MDRTKLDGPLVVTSMRQLPPFLSITFIPELDNGGTALSSWSSFPSPTSLCYYDLCTSALIEYCFICFSFKAMLMWLYLQLHQDSGAYELLCIGPHTHKSSWCNRIYTSRWSCLLAQREEIRRKELKVQMHQCSVQMQKGRMHLYVLSSTLETKPVKSECHKVQGEIWMRFWMHPYNHFWNSPVRAEEDSEQKHSTLQQFVAGPRCFLCLGYEYHCLCSPKGITLTHVKGEGMWVEP